MLLFFSVVPSRPVCRATIPSKIAFAHEGKKVIFISTVQLGWSFPALQQYSWRSATSGSSIKDRVTRICSESRLWVNRNGRASRILCLEQARLKARQGVRTLGLTEADELDPKSIFSVKRDGSTLGEIVLKGSSVMLGYFKDPIATDKCMKENWWFYTGDVGVMHADGYMEIKDRSKDVIISDGENLSSVEFESILYTHPVG
ncbi:hypothetical protein V6N11_084327 [Hibiscus sabdariffa]|uniref:AMP-dependent synthetase/ligase domain-containing protein n=1 Tax=Hibiscus sabdariffa TaxID=183260 RepID=A0ABR2QST2_9ROSI